MRGFVVAGLVVFHSAVAFASGASWLVTDPRPSRGFTVFLPWGSSWGMPLISLRSPKRSPRGLFHSTKAARWTRAVCAGKPENRPT